MNCFRSLLDRRLMVFFSAIVTIGGYDRAVSSETDSQGWDVVSELLDTSDGQPDQAEFCREDDAHLMLDDSLRPETPISLEVESDLGVDHLHSSIRHGMPGTVSHGRRRRASDVEPRASRRVSGFICN